MLSSCRYDDAKMVFSELTDYKDSKELTIQCDELKHEDLYNKANEAKEQKYYERAHDYFAQLADYKDSKKQAENMRCETIIAKGTKEINCAISLLNRSRFDKSIEKLETISYYNNVNEIIENFKNKFDLALQKKEKKKR